MKINLKNLVLFASVGCFLHESQLKTKIIISAVVEYKPVDDFLKPENIINYDNILHAITQTAMQRHFAYIEEMACEIAKSIQGVSSLISGGKIVIQKCIKGNILQEISCEMSF